MREIPGIPYQFKDSALLKLALTHRSAGKNNNERLEFLGDSILSAVVSARLFELKPENDEGELSRYRSRIVRGATLARLASALNLGEYLQLGEGEMKSGGFNRDSILADTLEAVFGAVYLDGGYADARKVVLHVCENEIANLPEVGELKDPKTRFQEWLQGHSYELPYYKLLRESGPSHQKQFLVEISHSGTGVDVTGKGNSRQKAEQAAAANALKFVKQKGLGHKKNA